MYKLKTALAVGLIVMIFASCTRVEQNPADEIRMNSWSAGLVSGSSVSLDFDGDEAVLEINSSDRDANLKLSGVGVIDGRSIAIFDRKTKDIYKFDYSIKENKLVLKYNNGKITLKRRKIKAEN